MPSSSSVASRPRHRLVTATVFTAVVGGTLALLVLLVASVLRNPFGTTTSEGSDAVVLAQIHDLSRYQAASGRFQTLVDQTEKNDRIPEWAVGERVVLTAEGDVEATVDFAGLTEGAIQRSADGTKATVHLPAPELSAPRLDPASTKVITRERGLANRLGDAVGGGTDVRQDELEERAAEKILDAAGQSDLEARAERNTEAFLADLLRQSGVEQVDVVFDAPPAPAPVP